MIMTAQEMVVTASLDYEKGGEATSEERALVHRCVAGDPAGYEALYDRWSRPMCSFAAHVLGSQSEAEDAVQETFLKIARSIRHFDFRCRFSTWLFRILHNTCRDLVRKRGRRISEAPLEALPRSADSASDEPSIRMTLRRLVADLPEKERIVFVLYEVEGFSHAEIAEVLGKSESYSKWLLFTTKKRLREELKSRGELP